MVNMGNKGNIDATEFENLARMEEKGRTKLIGVLRMLVTICLSFEVCFAVYFISTNDLIMSVPQYIFRRIVSPTLINLVAYFGAKFANTSRLSLRAKNRVISLSMMMIGGTVAIFHSYFIPLWAVPVVGVFFCTIFHDRFLHRITTLLAALFIVGGYGSHIYDYPNQLYISTQFLVISLAFVALSGLVSRIMLDYTTEMFSSSKDLTVGEKKYKSSYERDTLTKVSSRAILEERGTDMISRASIINPICVAIIDIDNFKKINDTYGHENGDIVLRKLGEIILSVENNNTVVGRFGGEEFVFIFENGTTTANMDTIDDLRRWLLQTDFDFTSEHVSFSGGFAVIEDVVTYEEALSLADKALYYSKNHGKNKITNIASIENEN